jgi:hypothetical protein
VGDWVPVNQNVELVEGYNEVALLSVTVGLQVENITKLYLLSKNQLFEWYVI